PADLVVVDGELGQRLGGRTALALVVLAEAGDGPVLGDAAAVLPPDRELLEAAGRRRPALLEDIVAPPVERAIGLLGQGEAPAQRQLLVAARGWHGPKVDGVAPAADGAAALDPAGLRDPRAHGHRPGRR